ncbi:MAG TPA: LuxR C-terminal-related transcriptional regulator [Chitinophagaceae bacterium]|jgi:predicted ATPase/DNA-binding CsgD family transcriptional regulator|nr:LuxR C-terminal-related transcriptional regulator [Chitinophagaceae bacterium]
MELVERDGFLTMLRSHFEDVTEGEGRCVFVSGEAGIGKTSLIKAFCNEVKNKCSIYQGICDALFTPRPLAPLYDVLLQLGKSIPESNIDATNRTAFFTNFFQELNDRTEVNLLIFEDIHWADEATLDFIKFFARRISQLKCLFILTYRDTEIPFSHPLRNIMGQLNPDSFTRIELQPLSKQAVGKMANERGYNGEDVYRITNGNPFYVTEILASYSEGVPDNIKDSILSVYNRMNEKTKHVWEILSVLPTAFEMNYLDKMDASYLPAVQNCIDSKILIVDKGRILFKHELYRRTIESSLSPLARIALNKKILDLLLESFEENDAPERIIHHAKNANEYDLVVKYAPMAAKQAASVGAHIEAARLYLTAIEYYQGNDEDTLLRFYESYAYECYLTNQPKEAIIYTNRALDIWKKKNDIEKIGNSMRLLSRLWWWSGNWHRAENFAKEAIDVLENQPSSKAKAMAYSNLAQLKMLTEKLDECLYWGEKAITIARELNDGETLSHALNNVGTVQMTQGSMEKGNGLLQQSLAIALKNSYNEHAARAYTNLGCNSVMLKNYAEAEKFFEEGIRYSEERDLDAWSSYMLSWTARLKLETGHWKEAYSIAETLLKNETQTPVIRIIVLVVAATIKMRRGEEDALRQLMDAKTMASQSMESQRILPVLSALLEYEWINGSIVIEDRLLDAVKTKVAGSDTVYGNGEFVFWLKKSRKQKLTVKNMEEGYHADSPTSAMKAAAFWERAGSPYQQALALFETDDENKRKAIAIVQRLGATAVYERMKFEMRRSGIKNIPRGIRKTTRSNPEFLTDRELDVLRLLQEGLHNKEIATRLFISAKTVDHHISAILYKLEVNSRTKAVHEAEKLGIIK